MCPIDPGALLPAHELALDVHLSTRWFFEIVHATDQRALPGTARPDYDELLPLFYMQINTFEHFVITKVFMYIL